MDTLFHRKLAICLNRNDVDGANSVIMSELGKVAINHRADFVELLKNSDAPADAELADAELLRLYFDNIHKKETLIGTAFLVNMHNKVSGADGESEIDDTGVKASYKVMTSYFAGMPLSMQEIEDHQFDWMKEQTSGFIWDTIAKGAVGITQGVQKSQHQKKYGALEALQAQQKAKADLAQSMIAQRQAQIDGIKKKEEQKAKNLKIGLIVGGSVLGLAIVGLIYYKIKQRK